MVEGLVMEVEEMRIGVEDLMEKVVVGDWGDRVISG